jgi:hypothetical protein
MTTQDLSRDLGAGSRPAASSPPVVEDELGVLFETSPERRVHTAATAEIAFVTGLLAALAVPFSLMLAVSLGLAVVALVTAVVGLARASRRGVAGSLLASVGLVLSLATLSLGGLRYLGIDTAFGDAAVPTITDWLAALNDLLPASMR